MNPEELLSALIQLSKVDSNFDEFEFTYLIKVGDHIGLSDYRVEEMIKNTEKISLSIPQKEQDRMQILYYMLFLMKIDEKVSEEERKLVHHYGFKLGFAVEMIDDFIKLITDNLDKKVSTQDMLAIIKKFQN